MAKSNPYLMVSLEDAESKALAQVLSNDTSRGIMKYMTEHDKATESDIAEAMGIPLSTVHYNIQNLVKAGLVRAAEFHYSEKGKEVMHYTLSNKIIIIAPNREDRFRLLKRMLPVIALFGLIGAGFSLLKKSVTKELFFKANIIAAKSSDALLMQEAVPSAGAMPLAAPLQAAAPIYTNIVFLLIVGAAIALIAYLVVDYFSRKK
jgi:predicted transcriptional regulator